MSAGAPPMAAVTVRTNGELIAEVARLHPLDDVVDVTYGRGLWWTLHRPARLVEHDLALDGVDFRRLPEADRSVRCVAFDPPYVPVGGRDTSTVPDFLRRYGLVDAPTGPGELRELIAGGLAEILRVLEPGGLALVKSMNYVCGGRHRPQAVWTLVDAERLGYGVVTQYVHVTGPGPQPAGRRVRSPRANYSVLAVLEAPRRRRRVVA